MKCDMCGTEKKESELYSFKEGTYICLDCAADVTKRARKDGMEAAGSETGDSCEVLSCCSCERTVGNLLLNKIKFFRVEMDKDAIFTIDSHIWCFDCLFDKFQPDKNIRASNVIRATLFDKKTTLVGPECECCNQFVEVKAWKHSGGVVLCDFCSSAYIQGDFGKATKEERFQTKLASIIAKKLEFKLEALLKKSKVNLSFGDED